MNPVESALQQAVSDAAVATEDLQQKARAAVNGLARHVAADNGAKVLRAGAALAPILDVWAKEHELTPGEAALCMMSSIVGALSLICGPALARAIAIDLASGPRDE